MKRKTPQKYSEGNNETSEETGKPVSAKGMRSFVATFWCTEEPIFTDKMKYLAYGAEICPETKRHHWQAFLYTKDQFTNTALAKYLKKHAAHGTHPNVDYMHGTFEDNEKYCSKQGKLIEHGKKPAQGKRTDLETLGNQILSGQINVDTIKATHMAAYHTYGRTLEAIQHLQIKKRKRDFMTRGLWIWGEAGSSKSRLARHMTSEFSVYTFQNDKGWWDDYDGEDVVILDDWRPTDNLPVNKLLQMVDRYDCRLPRRCKGPMPFTSTLVIITTRQSPEEVLQFSNEPMDQIYRRFIIVNKLKGDGLEEIDYYRFLLKEN